MCCKTYLQQYLWAVGPSPQICNALLCLYNMSHTQHVFLYYICFCLEFDMHTFSYIFYLSIYFLGCTQVIVALMLNVYGSPGTTRFFLHVLFYLFKYSMANPFHWFIWLHIMSISLDFRQNFINLISDSDFVLYLFSCHFCSFGTFTYGFSSIKSQIHMKTWVNVYRFEQ